MHPPVPAAGIHCKPGATKKRRYSPIVQKGSSLPSIRILLFEMRQGAVGLGRLPFQRTGGIVDAIRLSLQGIFYDGDDFAVEGFRNITSFRYYYNNKHGFL